MSQGTQIIKYCQL